MNTGPTRAHRLTPVRKTSASLRAPSSSTAEGLKVIAGNTRATLAPRKPLNPEPQIMFSVGGFLTIAKGLTI